MSQTERNTKINFVNNQIQISAYIYDNLRLGDDCTQNCPVMCSSIGTSKISNFPLVPNGKLIILRCPKI